MNLFFMNANELYKHKLPIFAHILMFQTYNKHIEFKNMFVSYARKGEHIYKIIVKWILKKP